MKYLVASLLLITFFATVFSSCKTYWDVEPKDVYSPILLDKNHIDSVIITPAPTKSFSNTLVIVDSATVSFYVKKNDLKIKNYGVLLFYETLSIKLQQNPSDRVINSANYFEAKNDIKSNGSEEKYTAKIPVDLLRGINLYFLPVLTFTNNEGQIKAIYAEGYLQVKISPWELYASPNVTPTSYKNRLFSTNKKLFNITYDIDKINIFEFDTLKNNWVIKGSPINTNITKYENDNNIKFISDMSFFRYDKVAQEYHLYVSTNPRSAGTYPTIGALILDEHFNIKTYKKMYESWGGLSFKKISMINDTTLHFIYDTPYRGSPCRGDANSKFLLYYIDRLTWQITSLKTNTFVSYDLDKSPNSAYCYGNPKTPNIIAIANNNLFIKYFDNSYVKYYQIVDKKLKKDSLEIASKLWEPDSKPERFVPLEIGNNAYIMNNNLGMIKVDSKRNDKDPFAPVNFSWLPANSIDGFNQGVVFDDKLLYLVNGTQLWYLDPNELSIDFSKKLPTRLII